MIQSAASTSRERLFLWIHLGLVALPLGIGLLASFALDHKQISTSAPPVITKRRPHPSNSWWDLLEMPFKRILVQNSDVLFLLEPYLLMKVVAAQNNTNLENLEKFKWRYSLPMEYEWRRNSLTVGVFPEQLDAINISSNLYTRRRRILGPSSPFAKAKTPPTTVHLVYDLKSRESGQQLHLHIVVFRRIKHFLWLAAIPPDTIAQLTDDSHLGSQAALTLHYGQTEQIFDPFELVRYRFQDTAVYHQLAMPDDLQWFLGQLPTSRYLHCSPQRTLWLKRHHLRGDPKRVARSEKTFRAFKAMMRQLQMPFWMACGTLLGWHRQCHITPWTGDTDFATWGRYLEGVDKVKSFQAVGELHGVQLSISFGEPTATQELTFRVGGEKVDLFFVWSNGSHHLVPFHVSPYLFHSYYPVFDLCSGELLGHKLLVPCIPEEVVKIEYGPEWIQPIFEQHYDYLLSPHNRINSGRFPFKMKQETHYSSWWADLELF